MQSSKQLSRREKYPVIVLGAGPAGVSASLALREAKIDSLLIDEKACCGGQLASIPSVIDNFAFSCFADGASAQAQLEAVARACNLNQLQAKVLSILESGENILLECSDNQGKFVQYKCDYLIVATGLSEKRISLKPDVLGNQVLYHLNQFDVVKNKRLAIIGGGDSALLKALKVAESAEKIFVVNRSEKFKARPDVVAQVQNTANIELLCGAEISSLTGQAKISAVVVNGPDNRERKLAVDFVLAKIGYVPNSSLLQNIVALDDQGYVIVDNFQTSRPKIFAAGDITAGTVPRIATAVGQGMASAAAVISRIFA